MYQVNYAILLRAYYALPGTHIFDDTTRPSTTGKNSTAASTASLPALSPRFWYDPSP